MKKTHITFVVDTLAQHGAERYLFEILKAINKKTFSCSVLSTYPLNDSNNYYLEPINKLGINVSTYSHGVLFNTVKNKSLKRILNALLFRYYSYTFQKTKLNKRYKNELFKQIQDSDIVSILKIEVYNRFSDTFSRFDNLYLHLLSVPWQYNNSPFSKLKNRKYKFILMDHTQKDHVLSTEPVKLKLSKSRFDYLPLPFDLKNRKNLYKPNTKAIIGVFSRIHYDQPTIMFLFAFHMLLKRIPHAKMYFYGKKCDDKLWDLYSSTSKNLGIQDALFFKGHANNLKDEILDKNISFGWMNSGNDTIGYSSIEIANIGLPISFFNVDTKINNQENKKTRSFTDLEDFVKHTFNTLQNQTELAVESNNIFNYIKEKHDAKKNIKILENYYTH